MAEKPKTLLMQFPPDEEVVEVNIEEVSEKVTAVIVRHSLGSNDSSEVARGTLADIMDPKSEFIHNLLHLLVTGSAITFRSGTPRAVIITIQTKDEDIEIWSDTPDEEAPDAGAAGIFAMNKEPDGTVN